MKSKSCVFWVALTSTLLVWSPGSLHAEPEWVPDESEEVEEPKDGVAVAGLVISAAALAQSLIQGINDTLTVKAQADARAASAGPDNDDAGSSADFDRVNTPLEYTLDIDAPPLLSGYELGRNGGTPHEGFAGIRIEYSDGIWQIPASGKRYSLARAKRDTTPVAGSNNKTAVAAVATFSNNGQVQAGFTKQSSSEGKQGGFDVALANGQNDITYTSEAAIIWTVGEFNLVDDGDDVTVTPPVGWTELFHDFMQLDTSAAYRPRFGFNLSSGSDSVDMLDEYVAAANQDTDAYLETMPLPDGMTVDFTIAGLTAWYDPWTSARNGRTDREVIEDYLMSEAVQVTAPHGAQPGYTPNVTKWELVTDANVFPADSLSQGGFNVPADFGGSADYVGLYFRVEGSLLDAVNRAVDDPGSNLQDQFGSVSVGQDFTVGLKFAFNWQSNAASEQEVTVADGCLGDGTSLEGALIALGGQEFAQETLSWAEPQLTGILRFNSNLSIEYHVPECPEEINETYAIPLQLSFKNLEKLGWSTTAKQNPEASLPCGDTANGLVVCSSVAGTALAGDYLVVAMSTQGLIPTNDSVNSYQYGFVFEDDGNDANNYVPAAAFQGDYFQGTDKWYALEYTPAAGWDLKVTDASNNAFQQVGSAARAIIAQNCVMLVVPLSEFDGPAPRYRVTAFRHSGDFGQNPPFDYSADFHPEIDELASVMGLETPTMPCGCNNNGGFMQVDPPDTTIPADAGVVGLACLLLAGLHAAQRRRRK